MTIPFAVLWVLALFTSGAVVGADTHKPNVLMIILDDLNDYAGCLGGYDGPSPTPNIDRLALRGMLFTNAHCNAPLCNPSRTSVMTGLHPSSTGVHSNSPKWFEAVPDALPLPEAIRRAGYTALGCGKVFHTGAAHHPEHIWDGFFQQVKEQKAVPPMHGISALHDSTQRDDFDWGRQSKSDMETGDGLAVQWAIDQLQRSHKMPLFLAVGIFRPHLPLYAPEEHYERFPLEAVTVPILPPGDLDDVPTIGRALREYEKRYFEETDAVGKLQDVVQAYLASCSLADALVGRLLRSFEESGYAEDSIIVLWSDHGWHLGEKNKFQKHALWEPATRVPLIVVAPGVTQPESKSGEAVSLLDLYPTLMDLCEIDLPAHLEGKSLRGLLEDPSATREQPAVTTFGIGNHSVRDERWKYIRYHDGSEELYDMRQDAGEWTNLASMAELRPVKERLASWLPESETAAKAPGAFPNKLPTLK